MTHSPFYIRLILLACILSPATLLALPQQSWHWIPLLIAVGLAVWGLILMYLRKTGKSCWNGPNWRERFQAWPGSRRILRVLPGVCAALIPALYLLNRRLGLSDGQLGFACGVLLGVSIISLKFRKSGSALCLPEETPTTQQ